MHDDHIPHGEVGNVKLGKVALLVFVTIFCIEMGGYRNCIRSSIILAAPFVVSANMYILIFHLWNQSYQFFFTFLT